MKHFSYILNSTKDIKPEVLSVLSLIDAHPYQLPDTDMQSLGDLHDRLSVEFVDDCGARTRTIYMTMDELKSLISLLEERNKEILAYNQVLKEQEHALRRNNNHAEANRIECQMRQTYWISSIREIYENKLKKSYNGDDKIDFPQIVHRSGYYTRKDDKPKVVLENSTIYGVIPTYIHELMHAYYDEQLGTMNDAEFVEEPLAEYGMLKFLESFVNANPEYNYLLDDALRCVRYKQQSLGMAHYGFGEYLYQNHSNIPWEQMLHRINPLIGDTVPEYKDLIRMLYYVYPDKNELPKVSQTLYDILCRASGKKAVTIENTVSASKDRIDDYWKVKLAEVYYHINRDCAPGDYDWNRKGIIVADDETGELLAFVKEALKYDELVAAGKVNEITVNKHWPLDSFDECWKMLLSEARRINHGLLVVNVYDIRIFNHCWCIKQLAKQEDPALKFKEYVLLVIKDISWAQVKEYAQEHNKGEFDAMVDCFYHRVYFEE